MTIMKIGYPCINRSIGCTANHTFRLKSYSEQRLIETVKINLDCLSTILKYNTKKGLLFFRITSDLVPFASHPINTVDWVEHFRTAFQTIGNYIHTHNFRITMHPGQYTVLNSNREDVVERSIKELQYHTDVLDTMGLGEDAKIQIHVGGVYGDKVEAIRRFVDIYDRLERPIKRRLVIENDERSYSLKDCLAIYDEIGVPIVFDVFHHECLNNKESVRDAILIAQSTWTHKDGNLIIHYSSQERGAKFGSHAQTINLDIFNKFLDFTQDLDFDIMLEIKDKENSALKALNLLKKRKLVDN